MPVYSMPCDAATTYVYTDTNDVARGTFTFEAVNLVVADGECHVCAKWYAKEAIHGGVVKPCKNPKHGYITETGFRVSLYERGAMASLLAEVEANTGTYDCIDCLALRKFASAVEGYYNVRDFIEACCE